VMRRQQRLELRSFLRIHASRPFIEAAAHHP
jgi:hypothetical protein